MTQPREHFGDRGPEIANARNREIRLRLQYWHDTNIGPKPDGGKYALGRRAKIDKGGIFTNRYLAAPGVADDAPNVAHSDTMNWLSWQEPQSGGYFDRDGNLVRPPNRWAPIARYVTEALVTAWPNELFPDKTQDELDNDFAEIMAFALKHVTPPEENKSVEVNKTALLRHVDDAVAAAERANGR